MLNIIKNAKILFWDFDGVIKESVTIKTDAYCELFREYGEEVQNLVKRHHLDNGGISRYVKIPFYFSEFAGVKLTEEEEKYYCNRFGDMVLDMVVDSPWVPGVERYLRDNPGNQMFVLVTGTPQDEIEIIIERLDLKNVFFSVYGAPVSKSKAIRNTLDRQECKVGETVLIGDSKTDYEAAVSCNVPFVLRNTGENMELREKEQLLNIDNFHYPEDSECV